MLLVSPEVGETLVKVGDVAARLWRTEVISKKDGGWLTRSAKAHRVCRWW